MPFTFDTIAHGVNPLLKWPLSPLVLGALLASQEAPRLAFQNLRAAPSTDLAHVLLNQSWSTIKGNWWIAAFTAVAATRLFNRVMNRLILTRQPRRKIQWNQHVVVISGGARGIGGRVAQLLAARGAKIVVLDMLPETDHKKEALYFRVDVTDEKAIIAAKNKVNQELGPVSFVIACAGVGRHAAVIEDPDVFPAEFQTSTLDINAGGLYKFIRVFASDLLPRGGVSGPGKSAINGFGGHILMIASGAAFVSLPGNTAYNMSKAAALSLNYSLAQEIKHYHKVNNVRTSAVCPLRVESAMTEGRMAKAPTQFLVPDLTIEEVATEMVKILDEDRSVVRCLPTLCYAFSLFNPNAPQWLVHAVISLTGIHDTFLDYVRLHRSPASQAGK